MNFEFAWTMFATTQDGEREIVGKYQHKIYGESLTEAVGIWETLHGGIGEFEDGHTVEITSIREVE